MPEERAAVTISRKRSEMSAAATVPAGTSSRYAVCTWPIRVPYVAEDCPHAGIASRIERNRAGFIAPPSALLSQYVFTIVLGGINRSFCRGTNHHGNR